jgi:hypothetical protein
VPKQQAGIASNNVPISMVATPDVLSIVSFILITRTRGQKSHCHERNFSSSLPVKAEE